MVHLTNNGTRFYNNHLEFLLRKYDIFHKVTTPYRPQTSVQIELSNWESKSISEKMVNQFRKDWLLKIVDAARIYMIACKIPLGTNHYQLMFGVLLFAGWVGIKPYWAIQMLNFDLKAAEMHFVI